MTKRRGKQNVGEPERKLISSPISLWGIERRDNVRPRCPVCKEKVYACRVDMNRKRDESKRKGVGRPKKKTDTTRYTNIGHWCKHCEIFYYLDGTPNYKLHMRE